jgi:hypothetical protein
MKKDEQYYILDNKFSEWFEDPGRGYIPTPEAGEKRLKHKRHRRHIYIPKEIANAIIYGIYGAMILAIPLVFITEIFRYFRGNSSNTTVYIISAVIIGFFGGFSIGLASRLRS